MFGGSQTEEELKVGRSVADALSVELVKALKDLDLPIERASAAAVPGGTLAIETDASSSKKPGAAVGMGAGAAIGAGLATAAVVQGGVQAITEPKDTAEADAKRTAEQLAKQIKEIFAARGWTAAKPAK